MNQTDRWTERLAMRGMTKPTVIGGLLLMGACSVEVREPHPVVVVAQARPDTLPLRVPDPASIPEGVHGDAIRRGRAILLAAGDSLPEYVGNDLTCTNCHLDAGTRAWAAPWVGVYSRFPQYRSRNAQVNLIEDRINDCIQRSLGGKPLPWDHPAMRDIIAYMGWLSVDYPVGGVVEGEGFDRFGPLDPDTARGREVYAGECARCHGDQGQGTPLAPPMWGERSYSIGAGMARLRTAAAFIRRNMPFDRPGTISDQQAYDVAAYINSQPRRDFRGKENDWPLGDHPPDVAYPTRAMQRSGNQPR